MITYYPLRTIRKSMIDTDYVWVYTIKDGKVYNLKVIKDAPKIYQ